MQFVLIKEQLVEFNQIAIEHANGHEDMLNRYSRDVFKTVLFILLFDLFV